jgi:uncharacterized membrane protein YjjP (DUF1212 family)
MDTLSECLLVGIISAILYYYMTRLNNKKYKNKFNFNLVISFVFGFMLHYIIRVYRLNDLYCKKVCYNDECFMICRI